MSSPNTPKPTGSPLHMMNLVVAMLAGIISIVGGTYTIKNNFFPTQSYGSLQGVIRDGKLAKPLWLASVEVSTTDGAVVNTATTDKEGHYSIDPVKTGSYEVKFSATLHRNQVKTVKIEKELTSTINVDLVPEKDPGDSVIPESGYTAGSVVKVPVVQQVPTTPVASAVSYPQVSQTGTVASQSTTQNSAYAGSSGSSFSNSGFDQNSAWPSSTQRPPRRRPYGGTGYSSQNSGTSGDSMGNLLTQIVQQFEKRKSEGS